MNIHHTGIIVKNINDSLEIYEKLQYRAISDIVYDKNQDINIVFIKSQDNTQVLELIKPLSHNSSVGNAKEGYHHICYELDDCEDISSFLKKEKIGRVFTKTMIAPALNNKKIVFGMSKNNTLVEFVSK